MTKAPHNTRRRNSKSRKTTARTGKALKLTPEIQALYFQCLAGKLRQLSTDEQRIIVNVFNRQFPSLKREADRLALSRKTSIWQTLFHWVLYALLIVLGILILLVALEFYASAEVDPVLLQKAQDQADHSMQKAWQQHTEHEEQPVHTVVGADGTMAVVQNAPRRIVTNPDGSLGLSAPHTSITVIQPPTPIPTIVPQEQDTKVKTTVNGIDNIETTAVLPEHLAVEQLEAVKKIADNGTLIAQQRFAFEQYKINTETELAWWQITKSFILWGFLLSIPFIVTIYWVAKNVLTGWHVWRKEKLQFSLEQQKREIEYKLRELESAERQIEMSQQQNENAR
jgi:hypothetical protein